MESIFVPLNDTGITWSGEIPSTNNDECSNQTITSPQDCNTGRDFTHNDDSDGHAGFSFTKLDANGVPLFNQNALYINSPWSCVKDNVTGLIWEVKTNTAGIHNKNNLYQWGGLTAIGLDHPERQGTYYNDWNNLIQESNNEMHCGINNWRVPTVGELGGIVDNSVNNPSIDINYFPNTISGWYWTSTPDASNQDTALVIRFDANQLNNLARNFPIYVRLVHSN